jgi:LysR family transcriptional regulator, benzoate and cis,cis-muconate-responsive activator of ben and cat genes
MELRHLRYFVAVAEEENVTRAAARLRVAQPSLSRQVRDLEEMLGLTLFERSSRSLRLTAQGKAFLGEARAVMQRVEEALRLAQAMAGGQQEEIHVGYAPSLTVDLLPRTLRLFQEACPDVQVRLHDLSTQEMIESLRNGELHAALMIRVSAKAMAGVLFEPLRKFAVCVAAHPSHPAARASAVGLEQVSRERLMGYSRTGYPEYHAWLTGLFAKAGLQARIAEEHDGATSLIAAVEAGRGIALVQQGFENLSGPRLTVRPLSPAPPPFVVGVAHFGKKASPAIQAFASAARKAR